MSRGLGRDDNDRVEKSDTQSRMSLSQGRAGGGGDTEDGRADRLQENDLARPEQQTLTHEREEVRYRRHRYECAVIWEVGRFRTVDEPDGERVFYRSTPQQFRADLDHLSKQGFLLCRSVSVGTQGEIRRVVVLSKRAKRLALHHRLAPEGQAVYAGFVKPAEMAHDASIYKMYEAEAVKIEAAGGRVERVVLDFEFKKKIYGELNKQGDYGNLNYARRQEDLAKRHDLPIDLELAAENCRPAPMSQEHADFKIYGVNLTYRGRRAEWKGRELTAQVLAL